MAGCVHERQCLDEIYSVFFGKKWHHRLIRKEPDLLKSWSRCHYGPKTWQEWSKDLSDLSACIKGASVLRDFAEEKQPGEQCMFELFSRPAAK